MEINNEIILISKKKPDLHAQMKRCKKEEKGTILALQQKVFSSLKEKNWFALTDEEQVEESLVKDLCLGVYDREKLIAFGLLIINRKTDRQIIHTITSPSFSQEESVSVDTIFVDPDYRGYGIQGILFEAFLTWSKQRNAVKVLYTTIDPENSYSLNNALAKGFVAIETKKMYGGKNRQLLEKVL
ncbi:MAG: GNAT family N-acetyltransferase [Clostridiales bacterium]|nr:GNAT family N-acetyltransferase [Clostridiales bacterium]